MKTYRNYTCQTKATTFRALFILSILFNNTFAQSVVERYGRLQVNGSHVTAENGELISLAGNSLFWSNAGDVSDFYNATTVNHLVDDWETMIIRAALGVKESWDGGNGYIDNPQNQKTKIKAVIDAAIAKGIYVIVDWHSHNAEDYTTEAVDFFTEIAEEYGNNDHIIYEIYNEPINQSWSQIKTYSNQVIAGIRSKDPDNLIIVGTPTWAQDVQLAAADPILNDPNLAYTLHFYANSHMQWLRDQALTAMNDGIALFVTEWGTTDASGNGGYNPQESQNWMDFMIDNHISYVNWTVADKNEDSCVINPNGGTQGLINGQLTTSGEFIRNHIKSRAQTLSIHTPIISEHTGFMLPNPVRNTGTIETEFPHEHIDIYTLTGKLILSKKTNTTSTTMPLDYLKSGQYIVRLKSQYDQHSLLFSKM